jgi:hypothetical protein
MALLWVELSRIDDGIAASGCCDPGDLPPALPGALPWELLRALAAPDEALFAEMRAAPQERRYFTDRELPAFSLSRTPQDRLCGSEAWIGGLKPEAASRWFERTETLRGCLMNREQAERMAMIPALRRRTDDLLRGGTLFFECYSTKSLLLRSKRIPSAKMARAALRVAERMKLPVRYDESLVYPDPFNGVKRSDRRSFFDFLFHRAARIASMEKPSCSISSSSR